jgi:hypothetical protein
MNAKLCLLSKQLRDYLLVVSREKVPGAFNVNIRVAP